eukprot:jgi/Botrbrau1/531/Bobra.0010s0006.1
MEQQVCHDNGFSRFTGLAKANKRWKALIKVNGKRKEVGSFNSEEEAARCYDRFAVLAWGVRAKTNFNMLSLLCDVGKEARLVLETAMEGSKAKQNRCHGAARSFMDKWYEGMAHTTHVNNREDAGPSFSTEQDQRHRDRGCDGLGMLPPLQHTDGPLADDEVEKAGLLLSLLADGIQEPTYALDDTYTFSPARCSLPEG